MIKVQNDFQTLHFSFNKLTIFLDCVYHELMLSVLKFLPFIIFHNQFTEQYVFIYFTIY